MDNAADTTAKTTAPKIAEATHQLRILVRPKIPKRPKVKNVSATI